MPTTPVHQTEPSNILVTNDRQRQSVDQKALEDLAASIQSYGQLQPGYCRLDSEGKVVLIAGYRRLRACQSLGLPYSYILREESTNPFELKEMELHENLMREDLSYQDECLAKEQIHALWEKMHGGADGRQHSLAKTAERLRVSKGLLSEDIKLAKYIQHVPEVANAKSKTEAKKIVKRIEDSARRQIALNEATEVAKTELAIANPDTDPDDEKAAAAAKARILMNYHLHTRKGDMVTLLEAEEPEQFDLVWFDPPWGVGFKTESGSKADYSDDAMEVRERLPQWLAALHRVMKDGSHLYLKFGITTYEETFYAITSAGFTCSGIPIIWIKKGVHRTRSPEYSHGRSYEPVFFARKGSRKLAFGGRADHITTAPTPASLACHHPSACHPDFIIEILKRSCAPGARVLDPMCGAGSFGVACDYLQDTLLLDYLQIECSEASHTLAITNLTKGYSELIAEPPEDEATCATYSDDAYKSVKPGSPEWMKIWVAKPELQTEMARWAEHPRT
jgi:ParB family chromosome partitioning protein